MDAGCSCGGRRPRLLLMYLLVQGYVRETVNAAMDTLRQALAKNPFYQQPAEPVKEL